jgi:sec-independent protein translocase protein TatC
VILKNNMALDQVDVDSYDGKEMSFLDHVEEMRWHLMRSVVAILVFMIAAFVMKSFIFDTVLFGPKNPDFWTYRQLCKLSHLIYNDETMCISDLGFQLKNISMAGQFSQHIYISFMAGLIMAFPYVLWELWRFIRPALKLKERKKTTGIVFYSSILFFAGILFGYYLLTPVSVAFMGSYSISEQVTNEINLESYISFVTSLTFATGVVFELPILVYFLAKLGILSSGFMRRYRKHALLAILIIAAVVTPPDVTSQILMTLPLYALYELSIFIAKRVEKKKSLTSES